MTDGDVKVVLACKEHSIKDHDVFINYRVLANADVAQALYLLLSGIDRSDGKRVQPYLDKFCLEEGRPWEEGFLVGISVREEEKLIRIVLQNAALIILLISEDTIEGIKGADKWQDNVLLEYEYALEKWNKKEAALLPIYLGKKIIGASPRDISWKDFSAYNTDVFPDAGHKKSGKNVRETMKALFAIQGMTVTKPDSLPTQKRELKKKIEAALASLKRLGPKKAKVTPPAYATKHVLEWTEDDVKEWCLASPGLKDYAPAFTGNAVDGKGLLTLTEGDLKEQLKITKPLIIRKILNMIKEQTVQVEKKAAEQAKKVEKEKKKKDEPAKKEKKTKTKKTKKKEVESTEAEGGEEEEGGEEGGEEEGDDEGGDDEGGDDDDDDDDDDDAGEEGEEGEDEGEETEETGPKLGTTLKVETHPDPLVYKKVNKIYGYKSGWLCNECSARHKPKEPSYHCDKHNYDLCLHCASEAGGGEKAGGDEAGGDEEGGDAE